MPYVPPHLLGGPTPGVSGLFDAPQVDIPTGLFDIPAPGGGDGNPLGGMALSAGGSALKALMNGGNPFTKGLAGLSSAAGGFLGGKLASWDNSPGEKIGATIGGFAGSFLPIPLLGSFMGAGIGSALGSNFGPNPTVGPNMQGWLARDPMGRLTIAGASGDNGLSGDDARAALSGSVDSVNGLLSKYGASLGDLPRHFQIRGGENKMDPTIELGPYMAPMLNSNSLAKALLTRGLISGDRDQMLANLGGADPERIFALGKWQELESIHPALRGAISEPRTAVNGVFGEGAGFREFNPGNVNLAPAYQELARRNLPVNESTLAQWGMGAYAPGGAAAEMYGADDGFSSYAKYPSLFSPQQSLFG